MFNNHFHKILNELLRFDDFSFENNWEKKTYKSDDGIISFTYITNKKEKLDHNDEITLLKQQLEFVVEEQKFEEAVELRDKIKKLETYKEKISSLKKELDECVKNQDYERAIVLRDEINSIK
jgi:protein-arginine kinase activator protein McsA